MNTQLIIVIFANQAENNFKTNILMNEELKNYLVSLMTDTQMMMDEYQTPEMAFTSTVLEKIEEFLDCEDIIKEHCRIVQKDGKIQGEIHAYAESRNGEVLYLFYTDYSSDVEVKVKTNSDSQTSLKRPQGFYNAAIRGYHIDLDENSSEYKALKFIYDNVQKHHTINLVVLSNYVINNLTLKKILIAAKPVYYDVWDLKKIYANTHSLSDHVAIDIDFESDEYSRYKIPFIQMESSRFGYRCVQMMFPAKLLYQLYEKYNTRLLYNNVRYFLGLKGVKDKKPNVAMLDTLRNENEMFLAFNNGITALAKGIDSTFVGEKEDVTDVEDSSMSHQYITMGVLKKILDFRIINGGQTTAVLYNAKKLGESAGGRKVSLIGVYVQVKLIISDEIEKISGNIALSSNFQNKVKTSDFSVSNEYNTKMEKLSRNIIAPNKNNDPRYWFYERLRGQYDEAKKNLRTKVDKDVFDSQYPKGMRFNKEDVAKVWCNWEETPYDSVKGASTTYATFMKNQIERSFIPDEESYKETVALLIIYKFLMSRPENKNYANGKATVVAYAMSLLARYSSRQLDLIKIWNNQSLSDNLKIFLNQLCDKIYDLLNKQVQELNTSILSYGKTKGAYDFIKSQKLDLNFSQLAIELK